MTQVAAESRYYAVSLAFFYVMLGVVLAALGAGVGLRYEEAFTATWPVFAVGGFITLIAFSWAKNLPLYLVFTAVEGCTLVPLLAHYQHAGLTHVIFEALISTGAMTGALSAYALRTKRSYVGFGGCLAAMLLGVVALAILNLFLHVPLLELAISAVAVPLFGAYLVYDVQRVARGSVEPLDAAMGIFLDVVNIFVHLLEIIGWFSKPDD